MKGLIISLVMSVTLALADDAALQEFISGNNLFTGSVYKELLKKENGNFLVSPLSAETVLALTQSGAKSETAQEIKTALHLPNDQAKIESAVKNLQTKLNENDIYSFQTANKIYVKEGFSINPEFKKVATDVFNADLENIDFIKSAEAAKTINEWVEKQTNNKIQNLINAQSLDSRTRAILINALYFKGNWSIPFSSYATLKSKFYKTANDAVQVNTMTDTDYYKYFESPELDAKFLELAFQGEDASMTFVLPNQIEGLSALEGQIDKVFEAPKYVGADYVNVHLPKFKIETKIDFKKVLKNLGVISAFSDDKADLSGIAGQKGDLVIDEVIQKTFVDVNEEGVEAAAATYVEIAVPLSGFIRPHPPKKFVADHPFLFYIKVKGAIVFAGRVVSPSH